MVPAIDGQRRKRLIAALVNIAEQLMLIFCMLPLLAYRKSYGLVLKLHQ